MSKKRRHAMRAMLLLLLMLLPLLAEGLPSRRGRRRRPHSPRSGRQQDLVSSSICDRDFQKRYCDAPYGGDLHTACRYCGIGLSCPSERPTGRGLDRRVDGVRDEILRRHNDYREEVRRSARAVMGKRAKCIPELK